MIIELELTGNNRKELVKTVSEIIGVPAEYQYMPTCACVRSKSDLYNAQKSQRKDYR